MGSKKIYYLVPFLLITDLIFGKYSLLLWGQSFPIFFVRNFLFVGLPYFLIGDILFKKQIKPKSNILVLFILIFTLTTLSERYILSSMNLNSSRDHYASTTFLAIFLFLYFAKLEINMQNKVNKLSCFIGSKITLGVYIIHPIFIEIMNILTHLMINKSSVLLIYNYLEPIFIYLLSITFVYIFSKVNNKLKCKFQKIKNTNL